MLSHMMQDIRIVGLLFIAYFGTQVLYNLHNSNYVFPIGVYNQADMMAQLLQQPNEHCNM
jgi:hypothetical protein